MTHDAATIAGINKRIAEYEGWTDIEALPGGRQVGVAPDCGMQIGIPRYWHSADAVLPVVERLCRERNFNTSSHYQNEGESDDWLLTFWLDGSDEFDICHGCSTSLPAAACLAVVAVLDGAGNETNNERTSE